MKKLISLLLLSFTFTVHSAPSPQDELKRMINPMVVELERKISQDLILESQFYLASRTYKIESDITLDFPRLLERYNYSRLSKIIGDDSLSFDLVDRNEIIEQQFKNVGITSQELASYVQDIKIHILVDKDLDQQVSTEITNLITSKIEKMTGKKPVIDVKTLDLPGPGGEANSIKDMIKETAQNPVVKNWFETAIIVMGALFVLSMFVLIFSLRKQADQIQKAVGQIQIQMPEMKLNLPKDSLGNKSNQNNQTMVISNNDQNQYPNLLNQIRELISINPGLPANFAKLLQTENNYESGIIVREISTEEDFQKLMGKDYSTKFADYMRKDGIDVLSDNNKMIKLAQDVFQTLKMAAMDINLLTYSSLTKLTKKLDTKKLIKILGELSTEEKSLLLSISNPLDVALAIQSVPELVKDMKSLPKEVKVDNKITSSLLDKVRASVQIAPVAHDPLSAIASYLPSDLENKFSQETGRKHDTELFDTKKNETFNYLNDLSIEDLSLVLPMLPKNLQDSYVKTLPDIKASRLKSRRMEVTERSLVLKHELMESLKG
jgi:hypothetical protein